MSLSQHQKKLNRQEDILNTLNRLRFATREQIQKIHTLGSNRNALKVLREMNTFMNVQNHNGKNVYYLNKEGREWIGSDHEVKWNNQAEHYLMRNDLYIYYGCPKSWEVEKKVTFKPTIGEEKYIVPDARFFEAARWHFVEVDRSQSMSVNKKKLATYAELSFLMECSYENKPEIIFYTLKESRQQYLKNICDSMKLDCTILLPYDLK